MDIVDQELQDPISNSRSEFKVLRTKVDDGVSLRVFRWLPDKPTTNDPVLFVAGWVSVIDGWLDVLRGLVRHRPVYYLETREKRSADIEASRLRPKDFSIARISADLIEACKRLQLDQSRLIVMGSSLGSTALLEALKNNRLTCRAAFLIGPNGSFPAPWWAIPVLFLPSLLYHPIKHFVIWYLKTFRVDSKSEQEQMQRYRNTLLSAHPLRIKLSSRSVRNYTVWQDIETIELPVAIAHASSDKLHSEKDIRQIVERLPQSFSIDCPTNKYMHSREIIADFDRFVDSLSGG